ncbi:organic solute transporter subunit beta [Pogona vitticeps]
MKMFCIILYFMVYVNTDLSWPAAGLALATADPQEELKSGLHPEEGQVPPEMLQELLWLFREEDPSTWNYSMLGLSCLVLVVGFFLLGANVKANRNRKNALPMKQEYETDQLEETEMKQGFVLLADDPVPDPAPERSPPQAQNAGQVTIQWKDGHVTNLYEDKREEDA